MMIFSAVAVSLLLTQVPTSSQAPTMQDVASVEPIEPGVPRWSLSFRGGTERPYDTGVGLVSRDQLIGTGQLAVAHTPGLLDDALSFDAALVFGGSGAQLFNATRARVGSVGLLAGASYWIRWIDEIRFFARALVGVRSMSLTFEEDSGSPRRLSDAAPIFGGEASLGVDFNFRPDSEASTEMFFELEVGQSLYTQARFDEIRGDRDEDADPAPIASIGADAGSLNPSGVLWRAALGVRF